MKKSFGIAGAFVGLIVGAGFASGQEIMQYFTSFGRMGMVGAVVATVIFAFLGMILAQIGSDLQTTSHKEGIYYIGGRYIGAVLDIVITVILFAIAVVMFAGSGSTFQQMYGINPGIGSILMATATIVTLLLKADNIIKIVAALTPYLMGIIFIILIYSLFTMDYSIGELDAMAQNQPSAASGWIMGTILYVSYNIASGAAMLIVMGGKERNRKIAGRGGILGGVMVGFLILLINGALFAKMDVVAGVDMPTLELAERIHPVVGFLMSLLLLGMMYSTAVGMFYVFTIRLLSPHRKLFKPAVMLIGLAGFAISLVGFTTLVGKLYSTMGYLGFILILAVLFSWMRNRKVAS
ncbi:YkvI family membrane protein [Lysinibacillus sp. 54212]|uniref:YkvI family membrane protein n=1 Tax=Lysinibacillus sp. 54212 TaxID=3119829 RepID=UPI002FCABD60